MTAVAATALMAFAAPLAAQPTWSGQGQLEDSDRQMPDGGNRYDDHMLRLEAGQRYRIAVDSEAFDPVAQLRRSGQDEVLAQNDDSAGLNPRITFTPNASGDYVLRVYGYSPDGRGAYTARAETLPPPPPAITTPGTPTPVTGTWLRWDGDLAATDPAREERHYDDYQVRFEAGQSRYILVDSAAFDTMVQIIAVDGRDSEPPVTLGQDDDNGVGLNSLLVFEAGEAGDYIIRVTSFGSNATGAYRLWVSQ
jgi:Bacterial pre-peptidase C-terminal domain